MSRGDHFLTEYAPLPEGITLPDRIAADYEAESCLSPPRDGHLVLRLRRRSDSGLVVLKTAGEDKEDLAEEFRILTKLALLLPGSVPEPVDHFEEGGTGYLLRSYLPGETLAQWREREGQCPEALCVSLGQKLCALLTILHRQEPPVIHRDIKPENIILLPDGNVGLIDFGIARQFKEGQDTDTRRMGTRTTAAPEQYGYAQTDQRTDIYALGMTLIWLVTETYDRDGLGQALSPRLRRVLERAVSFDPQARFRDAASFSAALAGQPAHRRLFQIFGAAALLCALAVGLFALSHTGEKPAPSPSEAAQQSAPPETAPSESSPPETSPSETTPPETAPPETAPPETAPSETSPPETAPPETTPPEAQLSTAPETEPVTFTSAAMEAAVRQALDRPAGDVTYEDLEGIRRLAVVGENALGPGQSFDYRISCFVDDQIQNDLPRGDIYDVDLALLEHMPNLTELCLCRQGIRDISPLKALPLASLTLCENEIQDLSPLASLTGLDTLYLGGNPATDYSPLASLTRLKTLIVEGSGTAGVCAPDSLSFLDGLSLRRLGLGLTVPKDGDWSPVARQTALEELQLWNPSPQATAAVNTLSGLRSLSIGDYFTPDLTTLSGLTGLEVLNIHKGSLTSLNGIQPLVQLNTLAVGYNAVTDLSPLAALPRLNYLQLEELAVTDFSPLSTLPALGYVVVPQDQGPLVEADCPGHAFELRTY